MNWILSQKTGVVYDDPIYGQIDVDSYSPLIIIFILMIIMLLNNITNNDINISNDVVNDVFNDNNNNLYSRTSYF